MPPRTRHPAGGDWLFPFPAASGAGWGSCPVCHQVMTTRRGVALTGEQFCDRHLEEECCVLCAMPAAALRLAIPLCRRCAATSIRTEADVRRELPVIKRQLATLGIVTVRPVRVQLASPENLHEIAGNHALGATISRGTDVVDLFVLRDLPMVRFGTTVAHEVMHCFMTQNGYGQVTSEVAEGLCQLLAYAWIIRQAGTLADAERRNIAENPDPIYGVGFRQAYEAARRVGVRRTLAAVKQYGRLP